MTGSEQILRDKTTHQKRRVGWGGVVGWWQRTTRRDCCFRPAALQDQSSKCQTSQDHPGKPERPPWDLQGSRSQVTTPRTRRRPTQTVRKAHTHTHTKSTRHVPLICPSCSDHFFSSAKRENAKRKYIPIRLRRLRRMRRR